MAWILVPLQYLFLVWKAEVAIRKAEKAVDGANHRRMLGRAEAAVLKVETMQRRFPQVIDAVDAHRRNYALRAQIKG